MRRIARRANRYLLPGVGLGASKRYLTGSTWATDGNGRGYNTPTLGSELLTNGDFSAWTSDDPDGWTVSGESGSDPAMSEVGSGEDHTGPGSGSANYYSTATPMYMHQSPSTVGAWYQHESVVSYALNSNLGWRWGFIGNHALGNGTNVDTDRASSAQFTLIRQSLPVDTTLDSISLKQLTLSTLYAYTTGTASDQTALAKINAGGIGTQAGVISLLDSAGTPANFIIGYHDGSKAYLDKCVGGTYTNLISVSSTFVSDAAIEIRRPSGNTFQLWYNGSQVGTDQTISDAGIISNTIYGAFSTYSGNTFSHFALDGQRYAFPS